MSGLFRFILTSKQISLLSSHFRGLRERVDYPIKSNQYGDPDNVVLFRGVVSPQLETTDPYVAAMKRKSWHGACDHLKGLLSLRGWVLEWLTVLGAMPGTRFPEYEPCPPFLQGPQPTFQERGLYERAARECLKAVNEDLGWFVHYYAFPSDKPMAKSYLQTPGTLPTPCSVLVVRTCIVSNSRVGRKLAPHAIHPPGRRTPNPFPGSVIQLSYALAEEDASRYILLFKSAKTGA